MDPERVRAWLSKREESRWYGQCLADMLAQVWNQNGVLMHEFQADECTDEDFASWRKLVDELAERALTMVPGDPDEQALCPRLKPFMARYSYRDGAGWWVCDCDEQTSGERVHAGLRERRPQGVGPLPSGQLRGEDSPLRRRGLRGHR